MSMFESIEMAPQDPILSLTSTFAMDENPKKVNLGVGTYKTAKGRSLLLDSVRDAEKIMIRQKSPKDYLPMDGDPQFVAQALNLIFNYAGRKNGIERIMGYQTVGGTGALSMVGFLLKEQGFKKVYLSNPCWANHPSIFKRCGLEHEFYPYYDEKIHGINFPAMCETINKMPEKSVILLQACCHNPTGFDLKMEQWKEVCELIKKRNLMTVFDLAYQGFGYGLDEDAWAVHYFLEQGLEFFVTYSFAKNFGVYGERLGILAGAFKTEDVANKVRSRLQFIGRSMFSTCPMHGAGIVATILGNPRLKEKWMKELDRMKSRVHEVRKLLVDGFAKRGKSKEFSFLEEQNGLFSFCGITEEQAKRLRSEFGIYMLLNGRINVAGLNKDNVDYVVESILNVTG